MEYSWRFRQDCANLFTFNSAVGSHPYTAGNLITGKIFNKYLNIPIIGNYLEIPVLFRGKASQFIGDRDVKCTCPLFVCGNPQVRRTFDTIWHQFQATSYTNRLSEIKTSKGDTYYGSHGIILDSNKECIFLCSIVYEKVIDGDSYYWKYKRYRCRVNPKIFSSDKMIEKNIVKKVIPYITNCEFMQIPSSGRFQRGFTTTRAEVIVDDFSNMFSSPKAPSPNEDFNTALNKCLEDNIDLIVRELHNDYS